MPSFPRLTLHKTLENKLCVCYFYAVKLLQKPLHRLENCDFFSPLQLHVQARDNWLIAVPADEAGCY